MSKEVMPSFGITSLTCIYFHPTIFLNFQKKVLVSHRENELIYLAHGRSFRVWLVNGIAGGHGASVPSSFSEENLELASDCAFGCNNNGRLAVFIFNPQKKVVTETEGRTVLRYIRGSELIARNTDAVRTYYHYASDEMGSITHVTDEEGNILNRYEYDAWGNLTAEEEQVPNRFKYTGEQFDPITQQYYSQIRLRGS